MHILSDLNSYLKDSQERLQYCIVNSSLHLAYYFSFQIFFGQAEEN